MYPANPQLWNRLLSQAKAKFPHLNANGGTNRAANKWLSQEYSKEGGQFVDSKEDVDPRFRDYKKEEEDKKRRKEKEKKKRRDNGEIVF